MCVLLFELKFKLDVYQSIIQYIAYTKDTCTPYEKQRYMIMSNFLLVAHEVSIQIYRSGEKRTNSASCAAVVQWVRAYSSHAEGRAFKLRLRQTGSDSSCAKKFGNRFNY